LKKLKSRTFAPSSGKAGWQNRVRFSPISENRFQNST
jgi:hypothetical protein